MGKHFEFKIIGEKENKCNLKITISSDIFIRQLQNLQKKMIKFELKKKGVFQLSFGEEEANRSCSFSIPQNVKTELFGTSEMVK